MQPHQWHLCRIFIQSRLCVKLTELSSSLLGGGVNKSLNLVGRGRPGVLFLLFGFWRPDLLLQLQLHPVSPCLSQAAEQQFHPFVQVFSFNPNSPFSNNCEQDAVLISIINGCTSVYSATVIYSIIGFRATENFDECMAEWVPKRDERRQRRRREAPHSPGCASLLQQHLKADKFLQLPRRQHHTKQLRRGYPQTECVKPSFSWKAGSSLLRHGDIPQSGKCRTCCRSGCLVWRRRRVRRCTSSFFRVWRGPVWPSSCSPKPSSRCPSLLSGPSCSSSCSSASGSPLCSATSREWWFPYRTWICCPDRGPKRFSAVISWKRRVIRPEALIQGGRINHCLFCL